MARTYAQFTALVRNWSNKDSTVLSDAIIQDCMRYAADSSYRKLRVNALEQTVEYTKTQLEAATTSTTNRATSKTELTIPADLVEFIQLREIDDNGSTCRVFNEKTDLRTFNDIWAEKTQASYWSRIGNVLIYSPGFNSGYTSFTPTKAELHYYKRLPALDAKYDVTPVNYAAGFLTTTNGTTRLYFVDGNTNTAYATQTEANTADTTRVTAKVNVAVNNSQTITVDDIKNVSGATGTITNTMELSGTGVTLNASTGRAPLVTNASNQASIVVDTAQTLGDNVELTFSNTNSDKYIGNEVAHWLRDENEKVLLYGALSEAFAYLQDDEQSKKYNELFYQEIGALNDEDNKRGASGGNVQINYNGRGLI